MTNPHIDARLWEEPTAVALGRLPMTTFLRPEDATVSLDGPWTFTLLDRPGGAVVTETTVAVPGCWTMQDVGDGPHYTNIQMPFPGPPPAVPEANPTGVYRRSIEIPADWAGQRVVLHIGGAETVLFVDIDGRSIGMGTDSRLAHDFDLTPFVTPGQRHELTLTVVRWGAATYLEDQDHWHHAGLHRSVFLYATPPIHLADLHVIADRDPTTGDSSLTVRADIGGVPEAGSTLQVLLDGQPVGPADGTPLGDAYDDPMGCAYLFQGHGATVTIELPHAEHGIGAWTAETPERHRVTARVVAADGAIVDELHVQTGFRRVEIVGHELLINGRAVLIKGVNRHDHDARDGKTVSRASIRRDLELMKAHNLNAVRTSHYPNDPALYDLCDELGLYVIDEANLESHAYLRALTKDPVWSASILARIQRMAQRDKNHPSIIVWSLGNESGGSAVLDAAATWLRGYDPTRPIQYESGHFDQALEDSLTPAQSWRIHRTDTDIAAPMYPSIEDLLAWATEATPTQPLIMCEYEHAMNNSCGDLDRYWDAIRTYPGLQGGFLWDWVDQALLQRLDDGTERLAYGGDFGEQPHDGPFCLNGLVAADRTPHPSLLETKAVLAPVRFAWLGDGRVRVTNEHEALDLSAVAPLTWSVTVDGDPIADGSGDLGAIALPAGASTIVTVPVPALRLTGWQVAHLTLRVGDVATWQVELDRSAVRSAPGPDPTGPALDLPTRLALWRAPIDNETFGPLHAARWESEGVPTAHERIDLRTDIDGDLVTHEVTVPAELDDVPRVGVRIDLPANAVTVEWLGYGPHENYTDRRASATFGRWTTPIDDWPVPYAHPQASGNRTGIRALRFLDSDGNLVCGFDELDDLQATVSRWTDEELAAASHLEDLPERDHAYLWLDVRHRGVGSGAVGPDVSVDHRIGPGTHRWTYRRTLPGN